MARQSLQLDPPGVELLHPDATQALAEDFELLLGTPTWKYLETLREAGKTHLCIRPYGALRYYPLHLLGPGDQDVAENWTVTSIPSLECLLRRTPARRATSVQALGLSYKDGVPFPLAELPGAYREVQAIAAASNTNPQLDGAVTEGKVWRRSLRTGGFISVHMARTMPSRRSCSICS